MDALADDGLIVNRKRVQRLMQIMSLIALYPKPRTSRSAPGHRIYPYLLRDLTIDRPNQVWCMDITYSPMARGFLYLIAVMDWYSRKVLSWRLSNTIDEALCVEALEGAIAGYGTPEIFDTDQGSQFTAYDNGIQARQSLKEYFDFYNTIRKHQAMDRQLEVFYDPETSATIFQRGLQSPSGGFGGNAKRERDGNHPPAGY